ncbi:MAG: TrmH family RNA methyltransferase [Candidatus Niyogibacteria bacterium]|nr:TrmH family RNA methyltransferase [Candidatus Niyogibacteria bacterium]
MIAILADIRSSHNVGSIFRTADAAGVEKLYLCGVTPEVRDRYGRANEKLLKVALGAEKTIAWEHVKSAVRLADSLKKDGFEILALEQSRGATTLFDARPKNFSKTALIVGNEIRGLSRTLLKRADRIIQIPMYGKKESLNVAVAFGIAAYQLRAKIKKQ